VIISIIKIIRWQNKISSVVVKAYLITQASPFQYSLFSTLIIIMITYIIMRNNKKKLKKIKNKCNEH